MLDFGVLICPDKLLEKEYTFSYSGSLQRWCTMALPVIPGHVGISIPAGRKGW